MSSVTDIFVRWSPHSESDRTLVVVELDAILASHHFRNSKRYPALLNYVVTRTLAGRAEELKERTLGVDVFGRAVDYDTNSDPVVRISAGEVRKRIAQFYRENSRDPIVEIDLPLGTYVPEFRMRAPVVLAEDNGAPGLLESMAARSDAGGGTDVNRATSVPGRARRRKVTVPRPIMWAATALLVAGVGGASFQRMHARSATEMLFKPLLRTPGAVQIVISNGLREVRTPPDPAHDILASQLHGAYNRVSVCDTVAISRVAAELGMQTKPYEIKEADLTNLQDLRRRPAILIGAYNNLWTMRLMEPLRFHFVKDGHGVRIVDARDPLNLSWTVDYTRPTSPTLYDYAIVARYADPTTSGILLIIAGIGPYGTQAAGEAVTIPGDLERLVGGMPRGWQDANLELVLRTPIIHGETGPAQLVASYTW